MTTDATEVIVAGNGRVWVAATTASAPVDSDTALGAGWTELGFVSEEGATIADAKDVTDILAWQSFYPIRKVVTGKSLTLTFALRQWNESTVVFAFGGGTVEGSGDEYTFTPAAPEEIDERSLCLEWIDGTKDYRLYIPRGMVTETMETNLVRTAASDLPITFAALSDGTGDIFTLFTNDPSFATGS